MYNSNPNNNTTNSQGNYSSGFQGYPGYGNMYPQNTYHNNQNFNFSSGLYTQNQSQMNFTSNVNSYPQQGYIHYNPGVNYDQKPNVQSNISSNSYSNTWSQPIKSNIQLANDVNKFLNLG